MKGPNFIGVGPEKTGTTWIYKNLAAHPNVIFLPLNEIRYFGKMPISREKNFGAASSGEGLGTENNLYSKICNFLGVKPDKSRFPKLFSRVNLGNDMKSPEKIIDKIKNAWKDDLEIVYENLVEKPSEVCNV